MQNVYDTVERYLNLQSEYALLIKGKPGMGKTYYLKNGLFPLIKKTASLKNASKNYLPLYISLFGINSIADLERTIFTEAFSFLRSKAGQRVAGLMKAIARGYLENKVIGSLDQHMKDLGIEKFPIKRYDDIVVCIDDIERKGKGLSIQELAGYLNYLCDGFQIKIILIMNEKMVDKAEKKMLKSLKEKIIGVEIDFLQDFRTAFTGIVSDVTSGSPTYQAFLEDQFELFRKFIGAANGNLRTIKYLIVNFSDIFYSVQQYIANNRPKTDLGDVVHSELSELLKFALCVVIEFRGARISYNDRSELERGHVISILRSMNMGPKKEEDSYRDEFIKKYYLEGNFKFYESIFAPLVGGPKFKLQELLEELRRFYDVTDDVVPEHYTVIRKLSPPFLYNLADSDYAKEIGSMYQFAKEGRYKIGDYLLVFELLTRYGNLLNRNIPELIVDLKAGIDISIKSKHSDAQFNQRMVGRSAKYPNEYDDLAAYINQYKRTYRTEINKLNFDKLKRTFFENPIQVHELFGKNKDLQAWQYSPFLTVEIFDEFQPIFNVYTNQQVNSLIEFFGVRYENDLFSFRFQDERSFLERLATHITTLIRDKPESLSKGLLIELKEQISNIISPKKI